MCRSVNDWRQSGNTDLRNLNCLLCLSPVYRVALCKHDSFWHASVASLSSKVNPTGLHILTASRKVQRAVWVVQRLFTRGWWVGWIVWCQGLECRQPSSLQDCNSPLTLLSPEKCVPHCSRERTEPWSLSLLPFPEPCAGVARIALPVLCASCAEAGDGARPESIRCRAAAVCLPCAAPAVTWGMTAYKVSLLVIVKTMAERAPSYMKKHTNI